MPEPINHRRQFEEYATLEYLLLGDLRAAAEEVEDEASHRWLLAVMEALLDALPRKASVTRTLGAADPRRSMPDAGAELSGIDDLCAEQEQLLEALRTIHASLADVSRFLAESGPPSGPLREWMDRLSAHNRRMAQAMKPYLDAE